MVDRLEKALQRAREMRRVLGQPAAAEDIAAMAGMTLGAYPETPEPALRRSGPKVRLSEEILERNRIVARPGRAANSDIFRILRTKVLQAMARDGMRSIAITSANYGEGKSTTALNLALSIALDVKQTVLLVDLDLRSPSIADMLGLDMEVGLTDYIVDDAPVPDCLVKPEIDRLVVLPIARPIENSSELLGTPKMARLAQELKFRYADRIVIYDMPPLLTQDDTLAFLPHVDGVIMVVRESMTTTDDLDQCLQILEGRKLIGTVLNNCSETAVNEA